MFFSENGAPVYEGIGWLDKSTAKTVLDDGKSQVDIVTSEIDSEENVIAIDCLRKDPIRIFDRSTLNFHRRF